MTRVDEEQKVHGPVHGITVALEKTGSIISSCGIIMAGSFSSLMAGSLLGMDQLGFALAIGVLLGGSGRALMPAVHKPMLAALFKPHPIVFARCGAVPERRAA